MASAKKIKKYQRQRIRLDAVSLEERASSSFLPRVKMRKAFSLEASLAAYRLPELMRFLENLAGSRGPIFEANYHPVRKEYFLREVQLGLAFQSCVQLKLEKLKQELPEHVFHPVLEIFNQYQIRFPWREALIQPRVVGDAFQYAKAANEMADGLRAALTHKAYQKQVNAFIQAANRNYRTLMSYIELLFSRRATLWVIRLDLGYAWPMNDYDTVKKDREHFLRNLRKNSPVGEPFGYAWKLERPTSQTWRHHFLLFFVPQTGQTPGYVAQTLGDYWNTVVTKGLGQFLNCCALPKGARRRVGTGEINRARIGPDSPLEQAVWYMTQLDYYIRLRPDRKWKTFFGGNRTTAMEKPSTARRPGKRRQTLADRLTEAGHHNAMPRYREETE